MPHRTYSWSNYFEWKIKALEERRDFDIDILEYDSDIDDEFRETLEKDIKDLNKWLLELKKHKKDAVKSPGVLKRKIKALEEIKGNLELNLKENKKYPDDEETKELIGIYEEELGYVKRWLGELKV